MVDVSGLESDLASADLAADPDGWALRAYRVAVARSEMATSRDDLIECVSLLDKAGKILTAERAPLEHGRISTALGNCLRAAGQLDRAGEAFERAARLLSGRTSVAERAAALANVGLARSEAGDPTGSLTALGDAIELLADENDEGAIRTLGAALLNRAQAHQRLGSGRHLESAIADYNAAVETLPPDSPQSGLANHGLATALLEQAGRGTQPDDAQTRFAVVRQAIAALGQSLSVFTLSGFPFQHAITRHSLAVAYQRCAEYPGAAPVSNLAQAAHHGELALNIFDPRIHQTQWNTVRQTMSEVEAALAPQSPNQAFVDLLATVEEEDRTVLLRERLVPMAEWPEVRTVGDLDRLTTTCTALDVASYQVVVQTVISVLMELPDRLLELACRSLVAANDQVDAVSYNGALDRAIHARLFGPQRVRVRDLLEADGWVRP